MYTKGVVVWVNFTNVFGSSVRIEVEREREMLFTVCNAAHPSFSPLRWHLLLFVGISACDLHHSVRQLKLAPQCWYANSE